MKYSIVIPTYNHCDDLLKPCVEAIFKYTTMAEMELIISANGCFDNTKWYLESLRHQFDSLGFNQNLKIVWNDTPTGYAKATNEGIKVATTDKIILLNNDAFLLPQEKDKWLKMFMEPFLRNSNCGISAPLVSYSDPAGHNFAIFFAVMIERKVFDKIGLLNEIYGKGGGEDTEFCIEAIRAGFDMEQCDVQEWSEEIMLHVGKFPIYHKGEATVHDKSLVPDWNDVFLQNSLTLAKKYNPEWYIQKMKELNVVDTIKNLEWLNGSNLESKELFKEVIVDNIYDIKSTDVENKTVIDIGANVGMFSIYAAELGAKKVISAEPVKSTHDELLKNISLSGYNNFTVFKNIISDKKGDIIKMSLNTQSGHNSIFNVKDAYEEVETITLADLLSEVEGNDILLKLDCEGSEYDILGSVTENEMNRIRKVVIEIHGDIHPTIKGFEFIHEKLRCFGFEPINQKQLYAWDYDNNGNMINQREIPLRIEIWEK